jgi:hypothetical protein
MRQSKLNQPRNRRIAMIQIMTLFCVAIAWTGCQPKDVKPGTWLRGDSIETKVTDWRFTDNAEEVFIQTPTWYLIPHSTTIWCKELDGELYIGSYGESYEVDAKKWEKNVARNPKAKLRIDGKIYDVNVTAVKDAALTARIDKAYNEKYDMAEVFGDDLPNWWFYLVKQRVD